MIKLQYICNGGQYEYKKIEKFLKRSNGYITSSEIEQNGISRIYIPELVKN